MPLKPVQVFRREKFRGGLGILLFSKRRAARRQHISQYQWIRYNAHPEPEELFCVAQQTIFTLAIALRPLR